jgi:hypothetical protein
VAPTIAEFHSLFSHFHCILSCFALVTLKVKLGSHGDERTEKKSFFMGFFEQVSNAELCVYEAERLKEFADKANKPADPIVLLISAKKNENVAYQVFHDVR